MSKPYVPCGTKRYREQHPGSFGYSGQATAMLHVPI